MLIAGGGIGGLSAALALARRDFEAAVLERSAFTEESGAGIQLGPNATRILRHLDVLDLLLPQAFRPEAIWLFDGLSGRRLTTVPLGAQAEQRFGAPYITLHRADLHAGLKAAAQTESKITLSSGFDVTNIEMPDQAGGRDRPLAVADRDGTQAKGDALIGADGLWSTVRKQVAPNAALSFTGATAFRALLPLLDVTDPFADPIVGLWLGPGTHLVHYPVRAGDALNVVAVTETGEKAEGWNRQADRAALLAAFTRWATAPRSLLEQAGSWRAWSLFSLRPLPFWSRGAVTLLGDAAHPVLPYLAQGAGLAIEDAAVLARCLDEAGGNAGSGFGAYEAARRTRVSRLQRTAQAYGRIYHLRGPFRHARNVGLAFRNADAALSRFDWLYGEEI